MTTRQVAGSSSLHVVALGEQAAVQAAQVEAPAGMGDGSGMATTRQSFLWASSSERRRFVAGGNDGLDEELAHCLGRRLVELAVGGDDAAVGRHRVAGQRQLRTPAARVGAVAAPQGLACLMMTMAGSLCSAAAVQADSRSTMLLNDSSLPCSTFAVASPVQAAPRST